MIDVFAYNRYRAQGGTKSYKEFAAAGAMTGKAPTSEVSSPVRSAECTYTQSSLTAKIDNEVADCVERKKKASFLGLGARKSYEPACRIEVESKYSQCLSDLDKKESELSAKENAAALSASSMAKVALVVVMGVVFYFVVNR